MKDVVFIMSIYGTEYGVDKGAAVKFLEAMVPNTNTNTDALRRVRRALLFVEAHCDHLSVLGGAAMKATMVRAVLPFAQLMQPSMVEGRTYVPDSVHCQCSFLLSFFILQAHNH
jgi:hypothetical protein